MSVWFVSVFPIAITQTGRHSHNTCCKIELINKLTKPDVIYLSVDSCILLHGASARKLDCNILVAGDFNLSKMDWDHMCPSPDCKHPSFYRQITEVLKDSNLTQTVSISTRDSNILDLFFTTNPTFVQRVSILQGISNHGIVQIQVNTSTFAGKYLQPQNMLHLAFADTTRQQLLNQTTSHCE